MPQVSPAWPAERIEAVRFRPTPNPWGRHDRGSAATVETADGDVTITLSGIPPSEAVRRWEGRNPLFGLSGSLGGEDTRSSGLGWVVGRLLTFIAVLAVIVGLALTADEETVVAGALAVMIGSVAAYGGVALARWSSRRQEQIRAEGKVVAIPTPSATPPNLTAWLREPTVLLTGLSFAGGLLITLGLIVGAAQGQTVDSPFDRADELRMGDEGTFTVIRDGEIIVVPIEELETALEAERFVEPSPTAAPTTTAAVSPLVVPTAQPVPTGACDPTPYSDPRVVDGRVLVLGGCGVFVADPTGVVEPLADVCGTPFWLDRQAGSGAAPWIVCEGQLVEIDPETGEAIRALAPRTGLERVLFEGDIATLQLVDGGYGVIDASTTEVLWHDEGLSRSVWIATDGQRVFVPHDDGTVVARDARTGQALWQQRFPAVARSMLSDDEWLYVTDLAAGLHALDPATGEIAHEVALGDVGDLRIAADERVVVVEGAGEALVRIFERETFVVIAERATAVPGAPTVIDDGMIVVNAAPGGGLVVYDLGGNELAVDETSSPFVRPAISDGVVYFQTPFDQNLATIGPG